MGGLQHLQTCSSLPVDPQAVLQQPDIAMPHHCLVTCPTQACLALRTVLPPMLPQLPGTFLQGWLTKAANALLQPHPPVQPHQGCGCEGLLITCRNSIFLSRRLASGALLLFMLVGWTLCQRRCACMNACMLVCHLPPLELSLPGHHVSKSELLLLGMMPHPQRQTPRSTTCV